MNPNVRRFVDSGAPSLYNTLARVDKKAGYMGSYLADRKYDDFTWIESEEYWDYREEYIKFIIKYESYIETYANLDVINNAEATWENQRYMESHGLNPIPVFHLGCDLKWLRMYLDKGYSYIAMGGMVPNPPSVLIPALDSIWSDYFTDGTGLATIKVHGFAITAVGMVTRYPWYSVDSTSWVKFGKYGIVCVPKRVGGKYDYTKSAWSVVVSNRSPSQKIEGKHITTFTEAERRTILRYFDTKGFNLGKSEFKRVEPNYKLNDNERFSGPELHGRREVEIINEAGLSNDYKIRDELNIIYYLDLERSLPEWPWRFRYKKTVKGFDIFKQGG
jgi:hypothetical protein